MKTYIGIDLGGTNVRVAKVSAEGTVLAQEKGPSYGQEGPKVVMDNIKELIKKIPGYQECAGIGIGVPGPCDTVNGKMVMSTNLKDFKDYPIASELTSEFNMPTFIDNDAKKNSRNLCQYSIRTNVCSEVCYIFCNSNIYTYILQKVKM